MRVAVGVRVGGRGVKVADAVAVGASVLVGAMGVWARVNVDCIETCVGMGPVGAALHAAKKTVPKTKSNIK
jgi:hypothetical protein